MRLVLAVPCLILPLLAGCGSSTGEMAKSISLEYPAGEADAAAKAAAECRAYGEAARPKGMAKRENGEVAVYQCG